MTWTSIVTDAWIMIPLGLILFIIVIFLSCDDPTVGGDDPPDTHKE